jgi:hypothetical protein
MGQLVANSRCWCQLWHSPQFGGNLSNCLSWHGCCSAPRVGLRLSVVVAKYPAWMCRPSQYILHRCCPQYCLVAVLALPWPRPSWWLWLSVGACWCLRLSLSCLGGCLCPVSVAVTVGALLWLMLAVRRRPCRFLKLWA